MKTDTRKEDKRKSRKYRLLILLLLMFGTGILLTTSTYAWFTSNKTVSVSTLDVTIQAQNGIQISVDGSNWKSIVNKTDLQGASATYAAAINQLPEVLEPVSTGGVPDTDGLFPMFYGSIVTSTSTANNGSYILTSTKETEANGTTGKFIAYDLFFKVDDDSDIWITDTSGIRTTDQTDTGIKNASRIGFIVKGNTSAGSSLSTIQGLNNGTTSGAYIWEPNYNIHTPAGIANARDVYKITTTEDAADPLPYSGVITEITTDNDVLLGNATEEKDATKFKAVTPTYKTKAGFTHYIPAFKLTKGITKVRIYMWVEGQDVDCENSASNGHLSFDLQITTDLPDGKATTE